MQLKLEKEPSESNLQMVAAWPGMGMLAIISADYLRKKLNAESIGEIETRHNSVIFEKGILTSSTFKHRLYSTHNIIICIGESQPLTTFEVYELADFLVDFAKKYNVSRVYTIAASLSPFTGEPKVFGVPNSKKILEELKANDLPSVKGEGKITGLNGVLVGEAVKKGIYGICLLGQIRYVDIPQPRTALNVLRYLVRFLNVDIDLKTLEEESIKLEKSIGEAIKKFKTPTNEKGLEYIG
jgi:predicted ATP-grasp superfamily ATP-dependent carboligase